VVENAAGRGAAFGGTVTPARVPSTAFARDLRRIEEEITRLDIVPHAATSRLLLRICSKILRAVTPPPVNTSKTA
jgi:hypothetical protein